MSTKMELIETLRSLDSDDNTAIKAAADIISEMGDKEFKNFHAALDDKIDEREEDIHECMAKFMILINTMHDRDHNHILIALLRLVLLRMSRGMDENNFNEQDNPIKEALDYFKRGMLLYSVFEILNVLDPSVPPKFN